MKDPKEIKRMYLKIVDYFIEYQRFPTVREVGKLMGDKSTSMAARLLDDLKHMDLIVNTRDTKSRARAWAIVDLCIEPPATYDFIKKELGIDNGQN